MALETVMETGLKHAFIFDGKGGGVVLNSWDAVKAWRAELGTLWVHLDFNCDDTKEWISEECHFPEFIVDILTDEDETRPRCVSYGDGVLVIFRLTNSLPGADADDMSFVKLWVEKNRIVSIRSNPLSITRYIQRKINAGNGPVDVSTMLEELSSGILDNISETVSELEDSLDALEDKIIDDYDRDVEDIQDLINEVLEHRRQLSSLRRYLSPQRDAIDMIARQTVSWLEKNSRDNIREDGQRMIRIIEDINMLIEKTIINMDELNSLRNEASQKTINMLSVLATLFLPFTFLTGLMGINVGGIPFANHPNGFVIVCTIMSVLAAILYYFIKKIRWL
ncbi:MAG: Zinc transport protein ZntB [Alphaproteobacteria bacterium ADurb.Bin438]|nr:MAG: Zinc transport protein ZntB [Alphaproteobacteria bacterium ADurb.Bin438]